MARVVSSAVREGLVLGLILCYFLFLGESLAQTRVYANLASPVSPNKVEPCGGFLQPACQATVVNSHHATGDNGQFARLLSNPGVALGIGAYNGRIELRFPSTLPANTWAYVRIEGDAGLFGALLGGSLGDLLSGLLATVLASQQVIGIEARNGAVSVLSRTSSEGFDTERVRMVVDAGGDHYLAIKPSSPFDRIYVSNSATFSVLGAGREYELDVYHAFYEAGVAAPCESVPVFTAYDGDGVALSLLGSNPPVRSPKNAIDANSSNYSEIGLATLALGASVYQRLYFSSLSSANSTLKVRMQIASAAVNVSLLGDYRIRAFNGDIPVLDQPLSAGIIGGVDVLGILGGGGIVTISLDVALPFDRVDIGLSSTLSLATSSAIRLYEVSRSGGACPVAPIMPSPLYDPVCAKSDLLSSQNTDDAHLAVDSDFDSYATIRSDAGILLGLGNREGYLEVEFDQPVPVGKTTLVRIDYDEDVLNALLGGTLGTAVADLVDVLLLGNHYFQLHLKNGVSTVLTTSSADGFASAAGKVKIVQDEDGRFFIAISSDLSYDRIRLEDRTSAAVELLASDKQLRVYNICYEASEDPCDGLRAYTSFDGSGLSLDLLELNALVTDIEQAVDSDLLSFSEISLGVLGIGSTTEQTVYFSRSVQPGNDILVALSTKWSVLTLSLLESFELVVYSGGVPMETIAASSIVDLDLLGLLSDGDFQEFPIRVGYPVDRIGVRVSALLDLNVLDNLRLSGVSIVPSPPVVGEVGEGVFEICEGDNLTITADQAAGMEIAWYSDEAGTGLIGSSAGYTIPSDLTPGEHVFYARSLRSSCSVRSNPSPYKVLVNPIPKASDIELEAIGGVWDEELSRVVYQLGLAHILIEPDVAGQTGGTFTWYSDPFAEESLDGLTDSNGTSYTVEEGGRLRIANTVADVEEAIYYLKYSSPSGCETIKPVGMESYIILPVSVVEFRVEAVEQGQVRLDWALPPSTRFDQVEVQRATGNLEFETVAVLSSKHLQSEYSTYVDTSPLLGRSYYRLKVGRAQETVGFSEVKMVEVTRESSVAFSSFPNPFLDRLTVYAHADFGEASLRLIDSMGRLVREVTAREVSRGQRIELADLEELARGPYYLQILSGSFRYSYKVMKDY